MKLTDDMLREAASEAAQYMDEMCTEEAKKQQHTFSPWFEKEMQKLIEQQNRREKRRKVLHYSRNAVAAVLVIAIALPFFNTDVRAAYRDFFQVLTQREDGYTENSVTMRGDHTIDEFSPAQLSWIPDGMKRVNETRDEENGYYHVFYQDSNDMNFGLDQTFVTVESGSVAWYSEDATVSEVELRGTTATLTEDESDDFRSLVWNEGGCVMELSGSVSKENLIKIAKNITIPQTKNK